MSDEQALMAVPAAPALPASPVVPEREKLSAAITAEKKERAQRVMAKIEQLCKEENCKFIASPQLVEQPTGGFLIAASPGILAL